MEPVAPPVGAWIEIWKGRRAVPGYRVAPPVGAWIEISEEELKQQKEQSLPPWERGLKFLKKWVEKQVMLRRSPRGSVD